MAQEWNEVNGRSIVGARASGGEMSDVRASHNLRISIMKPGLKLYGSTKMSSSKSKDALDYNSSQMQGHTRTENSHFIAPNSQFSFSPAETVRLPPCEEYRMEFPSGRISGSQLRNFARGNGTQTTTTSGDTFLLSQISAQTQCTEDQVMSPMTHPSPEGTDIAAASQARRKKTGGRELVDEEHLCTLVAAYNVHFEEYCVGKKNVIQTIPKHVWKLTYSSYMATHPTSIFKQDSLKERLRESLRDLKTGNSNEQNAEKVALQCNKVMSALRCTDGHAKRNILRKRQKIVQSVQLDVLSEGTDESIPPWDLSTPPPCSPVTPDVVPDAPAKAKQQPKMKEIPQKENVPFTKAQMLQKQSCSIAQLCKTYERSATKREALVDMKLNTMSEKEKKHRIDNLKTAKELGVISDMEFKRSVSEAEPLWQVVQDQILDHAITLYIQPGEATGEPVNWAKLDAFLEDWRLSLGPLAE